MSSSLTAAGTTARAEWSRIWTVRSSWWFLAATTVVVLGIAAIIGYDARSDGFVDDPTAGAWSAANPTGLFALFLLLALAVVLTTADHATGGIVPTLQWTPRRGVLLGARSAVVVLTVTTAGLLLVLAGCLLVAAVVPGLGLPAGAGADAAWSTGYVYLTGSLLAVGLGLALRSTAGGLVSVFGLMLVLPMLLGMFPQEWAQDVSRLLPGRSAISLVFDEGDLSTQRAVLTLALWAVAAMLAGGWRLLRTDADR